VGLPLSSNRPRWAALGTVVALWLRAHPSGAAYPGARYWRASKTLNAAIRLPVIGREHHLADPVVSSILTAGLPSRGMTVPLQSCHSPDPT